MSLGGCGGSPWAHTGWVWILVAHEQSVCQLLVLADQGTGVGPSQIFSVRSCAAELYYILNMTAVSLWHLIMKSHLKVHGQGLSLNAKPFVCCYGNTFLSLHCQNGTPIIWHNRLETKNFWSVSAGRTGPLHLCAHILNSWWSEVLYHKAGGNKQEWSRCPVVCKRQQ